MKDFYTKETKDNYFELLEAIASLSNLYSNTSTPYLNYRIAENIFCRVFEADNLSRSDTAFDAKIYDMGIGIKTFIVHKKIKNEKIAEFNALSTELRKYKNEELALKLAEFRNERINFAKRTYQVNDSLYHCIGRTTKKLIIFNTSYDLINLEKIKVLKDSKTGISFKDNLNEYSFNYSKSTLFKKFYIPEETFTIDINILDDPFGLLLRILKSKNLSYNKQIGEQGKDYVILPLYSLSMSTPENKVVAEKSGLNQWNAGGRARNIGEVYIPIPAAIHRNYPDFFPKRDSEFTLITPSNEKLRASVCQDNSKALMTNPNKALSDWLLRKLLKLKEGELLTYEKLKQLGVDSVIITKINNSIYRIDFSPLDSYDDFVLNYMK